MSGMLDVAIDDLVSAAQYVPTPFSQNWAFCGIQFCEYRNLQRMCLKVSYEDVQEDS